MLEMEFDFPSYITRSSISCDQKALEKVFRKYLCSNENFTTVISDQKALAKIEHTYQLFSHKKNFIHIGVGGSSLGPEMLINVLGNNPEVQFHFLKNSDPESIVPVINNSRLPETLFFIVSKSGGTAETMAILSLAIEKLKANAIPQSRWKDYLVFCTDSERGDLRKIAEDFDLKVLPIPRGVGGRFSVLTTVGLFPGKFAQINLNNLLQGAKEALGLLGQKSFHCLVDTIIQCSEAQAISQTVLMPYYDRLRSFNYWFVQLWAESLGKEGTGLTPVPAIGAIDQHSQMQLFMDGPRDKFFIFIRVKEFTEMAPIHNDLPYPSLQTLNGSHLAQLIQCQLKGTLLAMDDQKIPYALLTLDKLGERELGKLIMLFEILTTLVGEGLKINPFNQPGVEQGKRYAFQLLKT